MLQKLNNTLEQEYNMNINKTKTKRLQQFIVNIDSIKLENVAYLRKKVK